MQKHMRLAKQYKKGRKTFGLSLLVGVVRLELTLPEETRF